MVLPRRPRLALLSALLSSLLLRRQRRRLGLSLEKRDVHADAWHGQHQPGERADERHEQGLQVLVSGLIVSEKRRLVRRNFANLRDIMLLVSPNLEGGLILFVHDSYALELVDIRLESTEAEGETLQEPLPVLFLTCALQVVDMSRHD